MKHVHGRLRGIAIIALKAAVSLLLIAIAMRGVDSATVLEQLKKADAIVVAIAVLVTTGISLLHARRWVLVLSRMAHALPFGDAWKLVLIGYFFNQTLPSTVGGDAYRAWGAYRLGIRAGDAVVSIVVDRFLALISLLIMIGVSLWWLFDFVQTPPVRRVVVLIVAAAVLGTAGLIYLARFAVPLKRWRTTRFLVQVSQGARDVLASFRAFGQVVVLTIGGYAAFSYAVHILAQGMKVPLSLGDALLFVPLVTLVTVLPVSIAGWGLRESAMVVALGLIGVPAAQAFSLSVLTGLVIAASGIPGGILWLLRRQNGRLPERAPHTPESA
jgi:hypothetical protein